MSPSGRGARICGSRPRMSPRSKGAAVIDFSASAFCVVPALFGAAVEAGGVAIGLAETEACLGADDPAFHALRGPTARNASMFLAGGHGYMYLVYGIHLCLIISTGGEGDGRAVLLRAGEVFDGVERARERRPNVVRDRDLAKGPANLVACLGLSAEFDGEPVVRVAGRRAGAAASLVLAEADMQPGRIARGSRVGVSGIGGDRRLYPWRFWIDGDATVSPFRCGGGSRAGRGRKGRIDARNTEQLGFA